MDIVSAHAITDVHLEDGSTIWIEPAAAMSNETGPKNALNVPWICLDGDGNGKVETADKPGNGPTDGLLRVEVYPDRETAEKLGVEFD